MPLSMLFQTPQLRACYGIISLNNRQEKGRPEGKKFPLWLGLGTRAVGTKRQGQQSYPPDFGWNNSKAYNFEMPQINISLVSPYIFRLPTALGTRSLLGVVRRRVAPLKCPWTTLCTAKLKLLKPKVKHGQKNPKIIVMYKNILIGKNVLLNSKVILF